MTPEPRPWLAPGEPARGGWAPPTGPPVAGPPPYFGPPSTSPAGPPLGAGGSRKRTTTLVAVLSVLLVAGLVVVILASGSSDEVAGTPTSTVSTASPATTPAPSTTSSAGVGGSGPRTLADPNDPFVVSAGYDSTCVENNGGHLTCYGDIDLPAELSALPVSLHGVGVSIGLDHACLGVGRPALTCWGSDEFGQAGGGAVADELATIDPYSSNVVTLGSRYTCLSVSVDDVRCWGQVPPVDLRSPGSTGVMSLGGTGPTVSVAAGPAHACARVELRGVGLTTAKCWGDNSHGELGDGTTTNRPEPVQVVGIDGRQLPADIAAVVPGWDHSCAVLFDGSVRCWGSNQYGQLGDGTTKDSLVPVEVAGVSARRLVLGEGHTCALLMSDEVSCWGLGTSGQLGNRSHRSSPNPVLVRGVHDVLTLASGAHHVCAVERLGLRSDLVCWGDNSHGQLPDGSVGRLSPPASAPSA